MFRPVLHDPYQPGLYGVRWFRHPGPVYGTWPDCLGEWRNALPAPVAEAIRAGQEVYHRLVILTEIAEDAAERSAVMSAAVREQAGCPGPARPGGEALVLRCGRQLICQPDFSEVWLGSTRFVLSLPRADVVRALVEEWERRQAGDVPGVLGTDLLRVANSDGTELRKVFRSGNTTHESWGGLVAELGRDPADKRQRRYGLNIRQPEFDGAGRRRGAGSSTGE